MYILLHYTITYYILLGVLGEESPEGYRAEIQIHIAYLATDRRANNLASPSPPSEFVPPPWNQGGATLASG
jgi:hypothetical protein